ncbi:NUDIX domain-containing protein [Amnibacterium sp. CER49]|uniref:NUDIX domain-containing protein n=1 Tax=Amnibacterium sp. CER49 TaxID=3039161 RepID=UPI003264A535
MFRRVGGSPEVLLGHMGGPFWARKQEGAWSAPKGVVEPGERPFEAALREFTEETGLPVPQADWTPLGTVRASGKAIELWAGESDVELTGFSPGTFALEWPPRSGRTVQVPEIDALRWVPLPEAATLLTKGQRPFLERLAPLLER